MEAHDKAIIRLNDLAGVNQHLVDKHLAGRNPDELEILDDHPILVEWYEAMLNKEPLHIIRTGLEKVNNENMQTYIKYTERLR